MAEEVDTIDIFAAESDTINNIWTTPTCRRQWKLWTISLEAMTNGAENGKLMVSKLNTAVIRGLESTTLFALKVDDQKSNRY